MNHTEHGNRDAALRGEILRTVVGAGVCTESRSPDVQARVEDLLDTGRTPLPGEPDGKAISEWAVSAHRRHWGW